MASRESLSTATCNGVFPDLSVTFKSDKKNIMKYYLSIVFHFYSSLYEIKSSMDLYKNYKAFS